MRSRLTPLVLVAAVLAFLCASQAVFGACAASTASPQSRTAAPDFSLEPYDGGRTVSLSDLRGKVVLVYFWFPT
jgi:cytochrome oxidase Cu insertion factor (SCO1/SenC/PrrC family)